MTGMMISHCNPYMLNLIRWPRGANSIWRLRECWLLRLENDIFPCHGPVKWGGLVLRFRHLTLARAIIWSAAGIGLQLLSNLAEEKRVCSFWLCVIRRETG